MVQSFQRVHRRTPHVQVVVFKLCGDGSSVNAERVCIKRGEQTQRALTHVGLSKAAIAKVLDQEIAKLEANWTRDLVNHMSAYKSG